MAVLLCETTWRAPPLPSGTSSRLVVVLLAAKLTLLFAGAGLATPRGETVSEPPDVPGIAVTSTSTMTTPDAGTPPVPDTWTVRVPLAASFVPLHGVPVPVRVSHTRAGVSGVYGPG